MSNILFFPSHQPNPRFVKQINYLSKNHKVSVIYFFREYAKDLSEEYQENVVLNESLGTIVNIQYLKRVLDYVKAIKKLHYILKNNQYDMVIFNNVDVLILYKFAQFFKKSKTKVIIEISDLRSHTYMSGLKAKVLKKFEKYMFYFVDKLIVTSPKFYELYYNQVFKEKPFVLENKPLSSSILNKVEKRDNVKPVIGIVGLLLQEKPYKVLFETFKNSKKYEIHVYGKGTYQTLVEEYSDRYENIKYFGEYNFFKESAKIYASIDILYMPYDTTNGSLNNQVALPNKLYEAMYFQVPIVTSSETYLGELVTQYEIGEAVQCCKHDELIHAIENILDYKEIFLNKLSTLPKEQYIADRDYKQLENFINE